MFPQSELDNYKLQVELLQEKLQRSEISRQQLEHKLDKILQKRDEHDKMTRSKARQKYQQFLEEQQRRNERNKQLVQMLERIEQQTEVMNSRSERLKMMKLQYEMYFAKLVHSQTRRCIQNSVKPVTQIMSTSSRQQSSTSILVQPSLEGDQCDVNMETPPTAATSYPHDPHFSSAYYENELFLKSQPENLSMKTPEIPTLAGFVKQSRYAPNEFRHLNVSPTAQVQQSNEENQPTYEQINNNIGIPTSSANYKPEISHTNISYSKNITNMPTSSVNNLLPNNNQLSESKENSMLSTTTSSTFAHIPNLAMMKQSITNLSEIQNATNTIRTTSNDATHNNDHLNNNANLQPLLKTVNESPLKYTNQNDNINLQAFEQSAKIINKISQEVRNEIKEVVTKKKT